MPRGLFAGLATLDVVSHVERAPAADEKVTATWQLLAGGGPALNAAVVFAALGGEATLLTRLGAGAVADLVRADLARCGVEVLDVAGAGAAPPVSSITVEADGSRRVVGLDAVAGEDGEPSPDLPDGTDVVLIDGHHPDLAAHALAHGRRLRVPRILDAGRWKPPMAELLPRCTDVVASAGFRLDGDEDDVDDRLERLLGILEPGPRSLAAVTAGAGVIRWRRRRDGVDESGEIAPPRVAAIDTLGAGDALHGAYAWASVAGVERPLATAARVASRSCETRGTRAWLDHASEYADTRARP